MMDLSWGLFNTSLIEGLIPDTRNPVIGQPRYPQSLLTQAIVLENQKVSIAAD